MNPPTTTPAASPPPPKSRKLAAASSPSPAPLPRPLSAPGEISSALFHLRRADPLLSPLLDLHPPPSFPSPPLPPFHSLSRSILHQQLAPKAAASVYSRFLALCGGPHLVLPDVVLSLPAASLRQIGVSDRKASYLLDLARKYHTGILSDPSVAAMDDRSLSTMLTMVKGIGSWSVHMFMIFSLHRPDVLPAGDLGVRRGVQTLYALTDLPRPSQMEKLCEVWRPYRSVGAWYMWRLVDSRSPAAAPALPPTPLPPVPLPPPQQQLLLQEEEQQQHQHQQQHGQEHEHEQEQEQHMMMMISPILPGYQNIGSWGWR